MTGDAPHFVPLHSQWAVVKRGMKKGHHVKSQDIKVPARKSGYMYQLVKQATAIWLHPSNFNREDGFKWSQAWHLTIRLQQQLESSRAGRAKVKKVQI
jgi:hypothetical protein